MTLPWNRPADLGTPEPAVNAEDETLASLSRRTGHTLSLRCVHSRDPNRQVEVYDHDIGDAIAEGPTAADALHEAERNAR